MSKKDAELIKQLKALNENITISNKLTAINIGKDAILKDKKELWEKIDAIDVYDLPDKYVAGIVGSTPDSVKVTRSQHKKALKKKPQTKPDSTEK